MTELTRDTINRLIENADATIGRLVKVQDGREFLLTPEHSGQWQATPINPVNPVLPSTIAATMFFDEPASLVDYIKRFETDETIIVVAGIAGGPHPKVTACFDYHSIDHGPGFARHKAIWQMPFSEEWTRWTASAGKVFTQPAFQEFLEENLNDVVEPIGMDLYDAISNVSSKRNTTYESAHRLSNGATQIVMLDEAAKDSRMVPSEFKIVIPVFYGATLASKLTVFLRSRVIDGKLVFSFVINRAKQALTDSIKHEVAAIEKATGLTPLYGTKNND